MEKEEIELRLREKYDDEYTIKMFTNFVLEFQQCFSNVMTTEEVINRIKQNVLGNIKIVDSLPNENMDGQFGDDGIIYIRRDRMADEQYVKYLLFHEMLHAITAVKDNDGKEVMLGFLYREDSSGNGLNEAATEDLTQIRNEILKQDKTVMTSDYKTGVEQMARLVSIAGFNQIFHYYFYEPDKFKDYINSIGMNYEEIDDAFINIIGRDREIYNISHGRKLDDINNYKLYRDAKTIFDNYSKAIGEVGSLEKFEKKYKIFQTCYNSDYYCMNVMVLDYYKSIGQDVDKLLKAGVPHNKMVESLNRLGINLDTLKVLYSFSKLFVQDKNQTAINLYNFYKNNPSIYMKIFSNNYPYFFDHFSETGFAIEKKLYDAYAYPLIGELVKDQPEIDYSDVSYYIVDEPHSDIHLYCFYTSDSEIYSYSRNEKEVKTTRGENGTSEVDIKVNEKISCKLFFDKNGANNFIFNSPADFDLQSFMEKVNFQSNHVYSEKSDIEFWINEAEDEKQKESLQSILKTIQKRMESRSEKNHED